MIYPIVNFYKDMLIFPITPKYFQIQRLKLINTNMPNNHMKGNKKKEKKYFDDPELDKRLKRLWKSLEKSNHAFKGMTTQEVLDKIRED